MRRLPCRSLLAALALACGGALATEAPDADREWRAAVEPLLPLGGEMARKLVDPADARLRNEMYRLLFTQIAGAYAGLFYADPKHPEFWPMFGQLFNAVFPNPDQMYYVTPVDDTGVYRLSGYRGTVRIANLQATGGDLTPKGTGTFGATTGLYDFDTLKRGGDGAFSVILSPARPAGYTGDWWQLQPNTTSLLLRQIGYDWSTEVDGRFAIERLDTPATRPQPTAEELRQKLSQISVWARNWTALSLGWIHRLRDAGLVNRMHVPVYAGQMTDQRYAEGSYELRDDEALVLRVKLPAHCRYWGIQLTDEFLRTVYWSDRQNHLNGHTARLDSDGEFRAVISARDPGVPNWLDTAGYARGMIYLRYQQCDDAPTPSLTRVSLDAVRSQLPADTPVVTAAQREESLRQRKVGAQLRKRW